jgi:uncharacterized membrane protein
MPVWSILVLGAGTYLFRLTGPLLRSRWQPSERTARLLSAAAVILLLALAATATFTEAGRFAGPARVIGVAIGAILAIRRAPFPVVVLAAAAGAALARLAGLP